MRIRLSSSGHYPDRDINVTNNEFARLVAIENQYGYLDAGYHEHEAFLKEIYNRPTCEKFPTIIKYQ